MSKSDSSISPEEVFKVSDFESIQLEIEFKNLTSNMPKIPLDESSLIELGDKTLTLQVGDNSCSKGHQIGITIHRKSKRLNKLEMIFEGTGKILLTQFVGDNLQQAILQVIQYEESHWNQLCGLYSQRQDEISKFLESIKG